MKTEKAKGFSDYTGEAALKRAKVREVIEETFRLYGFQSAETPIIEYEEFVKGENQGDEAISDIFRLQDKGKRKLALRYEFTFQLKRLMKGKKMPYRRYQIGSVFRDEPIKTGRFREFTQCDVDIIGSGEINSDAEILAVAGAIFSKLKIPTEIQVNNRKILDSIIENLGVRDKKTILDIIREIDKLDKNFNEAKKNISKILNKNKTEELLDYFDKDLQFFLDQDFPGSVEIKELMKLCKFYGVKIRFNPSLARGLSYYTGNVFEIWSSKYNMAVSGGGRYEVNGVGAVGISFGLDRINRLTKGIDTQSTRCLILSLGQDKEAIKLSKRLREEKISCSLMYGKPSKALEYSNAYGMPYVIFIGEAEAMQNKYKIKDMKTGKENLVDLKKLIGKLK